MSQPITINSSVTVTLASYSGGTNVTASTSYPYTNAVNSEGSAHTSNYAQISASTRNTSGYAYYLFGGIDMPSNATNITVTCVCRARTSNANSGKTAFQLMCGNTLKGSAKVISSTTTSSVTLEVGSSWSTSDFSNPITFRTTVNKTVTGSYYARLYGASLNVSYVVNSVQYEITSTLANEDVYSIDPAGVTNVISGDSYTLTISARTIDDFLVTDNGVDVTNQLTQHQNLIGGSFSAYPSSYDSTNSHHNGLNSGYGTENGLTPATSDTRFTFSSFTASNSETYVYYNFDCSSIPQNATINSVTCDFVATMSSAYFPTRFGQLCCGTTLKGSPTTIINNSVNSARTVQTIDGGSWTRSELDNIKILIKGVRTTSTNGFSISFYGASLYIDYSVPDSSPQYYWEYTLDPVSADHTIIVGEHVVVPPDEDPQYDYYPITISSINANTNPGRGTTRMVEGSNQTITIIPEDPELTLVTDNGVDITNQLVSIPGPQPTSGVSDVQGASYGFSWSSSVGYYVSENKGIDKSAALVKVTFDLPVRSLVTISFINYAEVTYDYGFFSKLDTALSTTSAADASNLCELICSTQAYNTQSVQTLSYEMPEGEHFIYIKYRKDDATSSYNDTLQWKVSSIQELEPNNNYSYTLTNIQEPHSLIFIFGDVTYYFVNSSGPDDAKLYPDGSLVLLPNDKYKLTVVPDNISSEFTITDNNTDVTSQLVREEYEVTKGGNTYTVVNFVYTIDQVNATHNIVVSSVSGGETLYIKVNGSWVQVTKVYLKENGSWEEQTNFEDLFDEHSVYIKR